MDIKQEDLIKFWTWCGILSLDNKNWILPDGKHYYGNYCHNAPAIATSNIGLLYQYAIPKLQDMGYSVDLLAFECKGFRVLICDEIHATNHNVIEQEADNPTEALYKAIMEVIKNEGKHQSL